MICHEHTNLCAHWALGGLILVALASSEYSGAGTIAALPIAAISATLAAISEISSTPSDIVIRKRKCSDLLSFFAIWLNLLECVLAAATCSRMASATIDYMTKGHFREWLFGLESHSLGEPWPDVMGLLIIAVTTAMFMLGLEKSLLFSILLYGGMALSFLLFVVIGSFNVDMKFWNWTEDFHLSGSKRVLLTTAICSYAFPKSYSKTFKKYLCLKYVIIVMVPLFCYTVIIFLFTSMSHYRELAGTAIPLVRVFELRGVKWAVTVMAVCTVYLVCIALTEIIPSAYGLVLYLAGNEWKILPPSLLYRNSETGAPVLAIFIVGSLISILSFACPLFYMVRLLNVCNVLKCAFKSTNTLYLLYKAVYTSSDVISVFNTNVRYEKLEKENCKRDLLKRSKTRQKIKTAFDVLPRFLRQGSSQAVERIAKSKKNSLEQDDRDNLLMNEYYIKNPETLCSDSDSDRSPVGSDVDDTSSSTDIDSVVQEYQDRIQVTSIDNLSEKNPTTMSSRTVLSIMIVIYINSILISIGLYLNKNLMVTFSTAVTSFVCILLMVMPQNKLEDSKYFVANRRFLPYSAVFSVIINVILGSVLLLEVWHGFIFWTISGFILFCRCDCCNCEGLFPENSERQKLNAAKIDFEGLEYNDFVFISS